MAISKKLLIAGVLMLGMHQAIQTYFNPESFQEEISQILNFAQELRENINDKQTLQVANWLVLRVQKFSDWGECDILAITKVINNPDLTIPSKISALSRAMTIESIKNISKDVFLIAAIVTYTTIPLWARHDKGGEPFPEGKSILDRCFDRLKQNC